MGSNPGIKYRDVAEKFEVSKASVSQMIALGKKLPKEILVYFYIKDTSDELKYFTERKLRALSLPCVKFLVLGGAIDHYMEF